MVYVRLVHSWASKMSYDIWKYWKHRDYQFLVFVGFFFISVFHVFVKHKRDLRLKYVLAAFVFLSSKFYLCSYDKIVYNSVKLCNCLQFYSPNYIRTCNELQQEACLLSQFFILTISKPKAINIIHLSTVWY